MLFVSYAKPLSFPSHTSFVVSFIRSLLFFLLAKQEGAIVTMGWLIFFMDFCYGRKFFFYVRISIKEKFKYIVTLLLLNFITLPL